MHGPGDARNHAIERDGIPRCHSLTCYQGVCYPGSARCLLGAPLRVLHGGCHALPAALTCHMCVWSILPMGKRSKRETAFTTDRISLPQATSCSVGQMAVISTMSHKGYPKEALVPEGGCCAAGTPCLVLLFLALAHHNLYPCLLSNTTAQRTPSLEHGPSPLPRLLFAEKPKAGLQAWCSTAHPCALCRDVRA